MAPVEFRDGRDPDLRDGFLSFVLDVLASAELSSQYFQARQYAPRLLSMLKFQGIHRRQSLLKAVETLRLMNQDEQAVVPKNAPREFVPRRWRPYVFDDEKMVPLRKV